MTRIEDALTTEIIEITQIHSRALRDLSRKAPSLLDATTHTQETCAPHPLSVLSA